VVTLIVPAAGVDDAAAGACRAGALSAFVGPDCGALPPFGPAVAAGAEGVEAAAELDAVEPPHALAMTKAATVITAFLRINGSLLIGVVLQIVTHHPFRRHKGAFSCPAVVTNAVNRPYLLVKARDKPAGTTCSILVAIRTQSALPVPRW
jgi:hypothetical protein